MAEYISFQPSDFFSTKLYTGNGTAIGSGGNAITGVGFQPDFTWIKNRGTQGNQNFDSVRGATEVIWSDDSGAEVTRAESLTTWGADGFTCGSDGDVNTNTQTYVSWNWKAGTTTGITTDGSTTITPSAYSFNATSKCSILQYSGNGSAGAKVAHGLGVAPTFIVIKRTDATAHWTIYHHSLGNEYKLYLNNDYAKTDDVGAWNDTSPDTVNFTLGVESDVNNSSGTYVAYCFADTRGYFKSGEFIGNGNADGTFVYTGFRPAWIVLKISNTTGDWYLYDSKRLGYNIDNNPLYPNSTQAAGTSNDLNMLANGFKLISTNGQINGSGNTITYVAFAANPMVNASGVPGNAR